MPLNNGERALARAYAGKLGLENVEVMADWREAEALARDAAAGADWWAREDHERRRLMQQCAARLGEAQLLKILTDSVQGHAVATYECALAAGGDEALARVASGAALMALHQRALALIAGCGPDHLFVQKYALFAAGRWPLGNRGAVLTIF